MIAVYPVSDSVGPVHPLPGIDVSNVGRELVCVPVRIQFRLIHPKPVSRHHLIPFFHSNSRPTALTYSGNCKGYQRFIVPSTSYKYGRPHVRLLTDTPIPFSRHLTIASHFATRMVLLEGRSSTFERCRLIS
jgi:hypothetical protein